MCVKRWHKPLVGNLGDPVGLMPLNLATRVRRRWEPVGGEAFVYIKRWGQWRGWIGGKESTSLRPLASPSPCLSGAYIVWGGYIDSTARGKPLFEEGKHKIEREVNDFHFERMNSPPQTSSLEYLAQASVRYPIVAQATEKYLCIPVSSATTERSFSKMGHIVRTRQARLLEEQVKELSFLSSN